MALKNPSKRQMVKDKLIALIYKEGLKPGDKILSQNELAELFKVNPMTVVKALGDLCEEKILYRENGRGTFVGDAALTRKNRRICMVLPGKDLDRPEINPTCWREVHMWFSAFMECMRKDMTFSSVVISPDDDEITSLAKLAEFDVSFFLSPRGYEELISLMQEKNVSCPVSGDEPVKGVDCLCLPFDRYASVSSGIHHMLSLGYRRIAFLCSSDPWFEIGADAYRKVMRDAGMAKSDICIVKADADYGKAVDSVLKAGSFDAVFTSDTTLGLNFVNLLQRRGISVPEDMGVMSDEGLELASMYPPYMTSVLYPCKQIVNFIISFMEANHYKYKKTYRQAFYGDVYPGKTCMEHKVS